MLPCPAHPATLPEQEQEPEGYNLRSSPARALTHLPQRRLALLERLPRRLGQLVPDLLDQTVRARLVRRQHVGLTDGSQTRLVRRLALVSYAEQGRAGALTRLRGRAEGAFEAAGDALAGEEDVGGYTCQLCMSGTALGGGKKTRGIGRGRCKWCKVSKGAKAG